MATRKQLICRCQELGVAARDDGANLSIDAPRGMVFAASEQHSHTIHNDHGEWKRAEMYAELIAEMCDGLAKCELADCDSCTENISEAEMDDMYGERITS